MAQEKKAPNRQQVRQMRQLMATGGGTKAVERRFGEQAKASPEFKEAQRQRGLARSKQRQAGRAPAEQAKPSPLRKQVVAARQQARGASSLSR